MNTRVTIEINNKEALKLLQDLEVLHWITMLNEIPVPAKTKLSDKYKGVFSKEDAESFDKHTQTMRGEWDNI